MESEIKSVLTSSRSSNTTSPLSMISSSNSDGVVLDQEDIDDDSELCSSTEEESDYIGGADDEAVDGLVLMGSTRLRPAPSNSSMDSVSRQALYTQTFLKMFAKSDCTHTILPLALHGNLHNNPFRSLCWRVFLNVLPSNTDQWSSRIKSLRENYLFLQEKYHTSQRLQDSSIDLAINNPLSQAEESPWYQHFQDSELRRVVQQDVVRVFPEVEYFQNNEIKEKLLNVLFLYAKTHPDLGYRQGMHELAAPLLYVIQTDCDAFHSLRTALMNDSQGNEAARHMDSVIDPEIFDKSSSEADTYSLFEALMEGQLSDWYRTSQARHDAGSSLDKPWSRPQDTASGNLLVSNLNNIHDVLLRRHDPALYTRLEKLEIFPQLYGIRWLRLLFGREFAFRETLMLWDAIFADSCPPSLCDQLVVALLMALRDLLLRYEYQDAVQLLMKLPSNLSVTFCTQFALHLKDPVRFPKPSGSAFNCGYSDTNLKSRRMEKLRESKNSSRRTKLSAMDKPPSDKDKPSKEMTKPNPYKKYSLHDDTSSDFTVLDLHKDVDEEDFQDIGTDREKVSVRFNAMKHINRNPDPALPISNLGKDEDPDKRSLNMTVIKLEKLLRQEPNLVRKNDIFHCIGTLRLLLAPGEGEPSSKEANGEKNGRKGFGRTTSVAEDVSSYFKVEMNQ